MRDTATRIKDTLAALERQKDVWLATADLAGSPHMIAVSAWWDGHEFVIATRAATQTAHNLAMNPKVKIARGAPSDAILIDAQVIESAPAETEPALCREFAAAVGWNPSEEGEGWILYRLRPTRIQAYRGYGEVNGRDVMLRSRWVI